MYLNDAERFAKPAGSRALPLVTCARSGGLVGHVDEQALQLRWREVLLVVIDIPHRVQPLAVRHDPAGEDADKSPVRVGKNSLEAIRPTSGPVSEELGLSCGHELDIA